MKIIAGLGNPGPEYVFSRHNAGWLAADRMADLWSCGAPKMQFSSMAWTHYLGGEKIILLKPLTYMNLSGRAVGEAVRYFSLSWEDDVLIIYDDVSLPFGRLRLRKKGSAGGHKGMASVIAAAGTAEVCRLRIGVGAAPEQRGMVSWVLGNFAPEERSGLPDLLDGVAKGAELWSSEGAERAMNVINGS
ncbi:MAG: aminoacyl-tRNA hydrolase [Aminivibrio sp.]|nr:aminoacyl-tRNA hydrolase [Synergistaceae bacterium]